tara:strand:- start:215 stop:454 length:240 start_codon:yes stop_codon:yes gene_type:complete
MNSIIEKQILEWKEELAKQIQKRDQANKVADEANRAILMIEGGIQAKEMLKKKIESSNQQSGTVELGQQSKTAPSKSKA